jgi:hypothetical protein
LKQEILKRQSLVDAVIAASSISFNSSAESDKPLLIQKDKLNQLKLYKDE